MDPKVKKNDPSEGSQVPSDSDRILVVDDDPSVLDFLSKLLVRQGFDVDQALNHTIAIDYLDRGHYSLVLTDLSLPDGNGIELINHVHEGDPTTVCILITGYGTMESAIDAIHARVFDYLPKPFDIQQLLSTVRNGLEKRRLELENHRLLEELRQERELLQLRVEEATENLESKLKEVEALHNELTVLYEIMRDIRGDVRISESLKRLVEYLHRALDYESSFWLVTDLSDQLISLRNWEGNNQKKIEFRDLSHSQLEEIRIIVQSQGDPAEIQQSLVQWISVNLDCDLEGHQLYLSPLKTSTDLFGLVGFVRNRPFEMETQRLISLAVAQLVTVWEENAVIQRGSQMASIGELTAEVAHDLRNGLSAFRHIFDHFFEDIDLSDPKNQEYKEVLIENLGRTDDLVRDLLSLGRPEDGLSQTTTVRHLLDRVLKISGKTLERNRVDFSVEIEEDDLVISGSIHELSECLINVIMNSIQAMDGGGSISARVVSTRIQSDESKHPPGQYVQIAISDTGEGIPPENLKRVFGRYFTTKSEGTGLGLAMLQKIARKYLGWSEIESECGEGTTVSLFLPQI